MTGKLSLREYVDLRVDALFDSMEQRKKEIERRLATLNELRAEVITDRTQFVTRAAIDPQIARLDYFLDRGHYEERHAALSGRVDALTKALTDKIDVNIAAIAELRAEIGSVRSRNSGMIAALGLLVSLMTIVTLVIMLAARH